MELGPRDRLSQAFVKEQEKGRTLQGRYGDYVNLDIRHLGEKVINSKLPFVRELCLKYENIDPVKELIPVRPVVHYMMGGIHTDILGATPLEGLFAAGEAACVSINGANRLGSNSLTELLVFGARVGQAAAEYASSQKGNGAAVAAQAADEEKRIQRRYLSGNGAGEKIADIRQAMHDTMESGAGIYRNQASLQKSAQVISNLQDRIQRITLDDSSQTFNTELVAAIELSYMVDVAEAIIHSASQRTESRGSHQRTDYPDRNDNDYLAHSLAVRQPGASPTIEYQPVTITRWPPGERIYGR
jgi:fumarate reductase flavoprotein subunit